MSPKRSPDFLADRRATIVGAAERCFAADGYDRTTIRAVARAAGLSTGALYTYFPTKAALLEAVCETQARQEIVAFREALARTPAGDDRFAAGLAAVLGRFLSDDREVTRQRERANLLSWYEASRLDDARAATRRVIDGWRETVLALLREEEAAGRLRPGLDLPAVATLLVALVPGLQILDLLGGGPRDWAALIEAFGTLMRGGIVATPAANDRPAASA